MAAPDPANSQYHLATLVLLPSELPLKEVNRLELEFRTLFLAEKTFLRIFPDIFLHFFTTQDSSKVEFGSIAWAARGNIFVWFLV